MKMILKTSLGLFILFGVLQAQAAEPSLKNVAIHLEFCTGTLVADRVILTAAHCLQDQLPPSASWNLRDKVKVVDGMVSAETRDLVGGIEVIHDVALLYLKQSLPKSVQIMPLARPGQKFEKYVRLGLGLRAGPTGWIDRNLPQIYKSDEVHFYNQFPKAKGKIKFAQPVEKTCPGDSGGPTLGLDHGQWYVVGVTSKVKNNLTHQLGWVPSVIKGQEPPDYSQYCGDYYTTERVSENLDFLTEGIEFLRFRNQGDE